VSVAPPSRVVLLGPQGNAPDVGRVVAQLASAGPVALVTAGWREWEEEDESVRSLLGPDAFNLRLWTRAEGVWEEDPELAEGHAEMQRRVRALRRAYNARLAGAMSGWIEMLEAEGDPSVLGPERSDALDTVRALDRHHLVRLGELRSAFQEGFEPRNRPPVARVREELVRLLEPVDTVVLEGGHVPALLNRLRLFGIDELLTGRTVVACSGGAMVLAERVLFFHDSPPWGPGHPEVGERGLGLCEGVLPLPHASTRLRLGDEARVRRFALRFAPDACVVLDPGTRIEWEGRWRPDGTRKLHETGAVGAWEGVA